MDCSEEFNTMTSLTITSPCIRSCCLDNNDICLGCFRSLDEIKLWGKLVTEPEKQSLILDQAKIRKEQHIAVTIQKADL